jgi:exodeoxyribonuclease VII large subunit
MIIGRGGGSIEDLWAFNEEVVARAIFASRIPVVSAVGHEIDFTISDFVADLRAATPTDAATKVVPELAAVEEQLADLRAKLGRAPESMVRNHQQWLDSFAERLRVVLGNVATSARRELGQLEKSGRLAIERLAGAARQRADAARNHLEAINPLAVLKRGYSVTLDASGHVVTDPAQVNVGDAIQSRVHKGTVRSRVEK